MSPGLPSLSKFRVSQGRDGGFGNHVYPLGGEGTPSPDEARRSPHTPAGYTPRSGQQKPPRVPRRGFGEGQGWEGEARTLALPLTQPGDPDVPLAWLSLSATMYETIPPS